VALTVRKTGREERQLSVGSRSVMNFLKKSILSFGVILNDMQDSLRLRVRAKMAL
jgi:hypothetical protein